MRPLLLVNVLSIAVIAAFALWVFRLPVADERAIPAVAQQNSQHALSAGVTVALPVTAAPVPHARLGDAGAGTGVGDGTATDDGSDGQAEQSGQGRNLDVQAVQGNTAGSSATDMMLDAAWLTETAQLTGIPRRALQAYAAAAAVVNAGTSCGIGWNTVAAIGAVESAHGTHGGGAVMADSRVSRPIIGPALDGKDFAAIPDTDGGHLDADTRWDRAVGPMQFIPSTWTFAGRDGNGDGTADPHNLDDAALSAAAYLCADGRNLAAAEGWSAAVLSYNRSHAYVNEVRDQANAYASVSGSGSGSGSAAAAGR